MIFSKTALLEKGDKFRMHEKERTHDFEWLDFGNLKDTYLYPLFIKDKIFNLPKNLELQTEYE